MIKKFIHSVVLLFAIIIAFIFPRTNLAPYDLQISAGLFIIFYLIKKYFVKDSSYSKLIESVIFTLVVLGIINSTGGLNSPFFFLIYFLLFSLSLLLEPIISITTTITLIVLFLLNLPNNQGIKTLLPIISLAFITPFAMFMGQEHIESQKSKMKSQKIQKDSFLFVSLILKNYLKNIKSAVENYIGDHELNLIKKSAEQMEKMIDKYEKNN